MQINNPVLLTFDESGNNIGLTLIRHYSVAIAGGAGQASVFLTSDGLTKSGSNAFTFSNVRNVTAMTNTIAALGEAPVFSGWSYNSTTGQLITRFLESAVVVLLAESLEVEENGTVIKITVIGD